MGDTCPIVASHIFYTHLLSVLAVHPDGHVRHEQLKQANGKTGKFIPGYSDTEFNCQLQCLDFGSFEK